MTVEELARLVQSMRDAQRQYFRKRQSDALAESIRLEQELDAAVRAILQPSLPIPHDGDHTGGGPVG